jgi:hypothetical protein
MSGPANPACSECISDERRGFKIFYLCACFVHVYHVIRSKRAVT